MSIKCGISRIERNLRRVVASAKGGQPDNWDSEEDMMETGTINKVFMKRDNIEYKDNQETLPKSANMLAKRTLE